jgi:hypothetical protein
MLAPPLPPPSSQPPAHLPALNSGAEAAAQAAATALQAGGNAAKWETGATPPLPLRPLLQETPASQPS